jgi:NAD+ synthase (glutamine-hydrolysing)
VPIDESVNRTRAQVDGLRVRGLRGTRERILRVSGGILENIQARDRSSRILAAVSAAFGGVFTCNANKSEAAVGYTTLYGDLSGYFANLADVWKTEVYQLAEYLNRSVYGAEAIPPGAFTLTPSAELSAEQNVDRGQGDPIVYPYHDRLFASWVEWWNRTTPEEILAWYAEGVLEQKIGYEGRLSDLFPGPAQFIADLERWWVLYQGLGLAKRIQAPPVLALKRRAFGFDHRESQMGARYTARYRKLRARLLAGG